MESYVIIIILSWIATCYVVGYVARDWGREFGTYFLLALLLSPVLGFIVLAFKGKATATETFDNTPHIFFCAKCNAAYGGTKKGTPENCPKCGSSLIETSILRDDWRNYTDTQKEEMKNAFRCGQFHRVSQKNPTESPMVDSVTEIKRYKELLDSGVITLEEFESKKKQLLGL